MLQWRMAIKFTESLCDLPPPRKHALWDMRMPQNKKKIISVIGKAIREGRAMNYNSKFYQSFPSARFLRHSPYVADCSNALRW